MSSSESAINKKQLPVDETQVNVLFSCISLSVAVPVKAYLWHSNTFCLP